jgi:hypothetical protein
VVRIELNQLNWNTSNNVGFCSEKNQSGTKGAMGKIQLGSGGSSGCTETARLNNIKKENGGCPTCETGKSQPREKGGLKL